MKNDILKLVDERRFVTFKELSDEVPAFKGDGALEHAKYPGIILWPRISIDSAAIIQELLDDRTIYLHYTPVLNYITEGYLSSIPLARTARSYKSPRWVPMTISRERPRANKKRAKHRRRSRRSKGSASRGLK